LLGSTDADLRIDYQQGIKAGKAFLAKSSWQTSKANDVTPVAPLAISA